MSGSQDSRRPVPVAYAIGALVVVVALAAVVDGLRRDAAGVGSGAPAAGCCPPLATRLLDPAALARMADSVVPAEDGSPLPPPAEDAGRFRHERHGDVAATEMRLGGGGVRSLAVAESSVPSPTTDDGAGADSASVPIRTGIELFDDAPAQALLICRTAASDGGRGADREVRLMEALALVNMGRHGEAIRVLGLLVDDQPEFRPALALLTRTTLQVGDHDSALELAQRLERLGGEPYEGFDLRLNALAALGRHAEASEMLDAARQHLPEAEWALQRARLHMASGETAAAVALLEPHLDSPLIALEWVAAKVGSLPPSDLVAALQNAPLPVASWARLAFLAERRHAPDSAVVFYGKAIEQEPRNPVLLNNLAWCLLQTPDFDQALALAASRRAHELAPHHPDVLHTRASVLVHTGRARECVTLLLPQEELRERDPRLGHLLQAALTQLAARPDAESSADRSAALRQ